MHKHKDFVASPSAYRCMKSSKVRVGRCSRAQCAKTVQPLVLSVKKNVHLSCSVCKNKGELPGVWKMEDVIQGAVGHFFCIQCAKKVHPLKVHLLVLSVHKKKRERPYRCVKDVIQRGLLRLGAHWAGPLRVIRVLETRFDIELLLLEIGKVLREETYTQKPMRKSRVIGTCNA